MANFQTNIAAKEGKIGGAGLIDPTLYQGNVRYAIATLAITTGMAANDTFDVCADLPAGARILPQLSRFVCHGDPGTTLTISIGDSGNSARYCSAAVLSSGGIVEFCTANIPAAVTTPVKLTSARGITGLIASATSLTATNIDIMFAYVVG
jgi:hypothetical protein